MRRLYNAVCGWLEADALARADDPGPPPEGSFTDVERADIDAGSRYRIGFGHRQEDGDD